MKKRDACPVGSELQKGAAVTEESVATVYTDSERLENVDLERPFVAAFLVDAISCNIYCSKETRWLHLQQRLKDFFI